MGGYMKYRQATTGIALLFPVFLGSAPCWASDDLPTGFKDIRLGQSESEFLSRHPRNKKYPTGSTPQSEKDYLRKEFGYDAVYDLDDIFHLNGDEYGMSVGTRNGSVVDVSIVLTNNDPTDRCLARFDPIKAELEAKYGAFPQNNTHIEPEAKVAVMSFSDRRILLSIARLKDSCSVVLDYGLLIKKDDPL
jgi:hypothetical protein